MILASLGLAHVSTQMLLAGIIPFFLGAILLVGCGKKRPAPKPAPKRPHGAKSRSHRSGSKGGQRSRKSSRSGKKSSKSSRHSKSSRSGKSSKSSKSGKSSKSSRKSSRKSRKGKSKKDEAVVGLPPIAPVVGALDPKDQKPLVDKKEEGSQKLCATQKSQKEELSGGKNASAKEAVKIDGRSYKLIPLEVQLLPNLYPNVSFYEVLRRRLDGFWRIYSDASGKEFKMEPGELRWSSNGGLQKIVLSNNSVERQAIKVKCSDNNLYRVNPVYAFVEPGQNLNVDIVRQNGGSKVDKIVFITAKANVNDACPQKLFQAGTSNPMMVLPLLAQPAQ